MVPAPFFRSAFWGGFECSTHRRRDGRRLDVIAATRHDRQAAADYRHLARHGIRTVRDGMRWHLIERTPGRYDWSSAQPMIDAAAATGTQVIWDLLHYGWPDWADPWAPDFAERFAAFAASAAVAVGPGGLYVPVNEISFLAWGGGEVGYLNPFAIGRGDALKRILCAAAIAAIRAIRRVDPAATIITAEPLINVVPAYSGDEAEARVLTAAQHWATDCLTGRVAPELGGDATLVDVVGLNFYPYNQFDTQRRTIAPGDPRHLPLARMLARAQERYRKPLAIAETGCEGDARPLWLAGVAEEVRQANLDGADVRGICLYPILNHPGWDDDRYCPNGLLCGLSEPRRVEQALADELARQVGGLVDA